MNIEEKRIYLDDIHEWGSIAHNKFLGAMKILSILLI